MLSKTEKNLNHRIFILLWFSLFENVIDKYICVYVAYLIHVTFAQIYSIQRGFLLIILTVRTVTTVSYSHRVNWYMHFYLKACIFLSVC